MYTGVLLVVSAAPGVLFLLLILRMDRREPEPLSLVLRVIAFGAASAVVASLVEMGLDVVPLFRGTDFANVVASSFIQVAPVEELCKLGVVLLFVWRNPNFNEENDGIVYLGASAIGFAVLENITYVVENGMGTGILRAFTAIPLHVFTAIVMGLFVGRARFAATKARRGLLIVLGFAMAWLVHGLYDSFALSDSGVPLLIFPVVAGISAFGIVALRRGRLLSLKRWQGVVAPAHVAPAPEPPTPVHHARKAALRWMAAVARLLLGGSVAFWALLLIGYLTSDRPENIGIAFLGGTVITFFPLLIGVILEIVYRRTRRAVRAKAG